MRISHVRISNILGIDELEFTPGQFTALTGANGSGKTSTLEAIKAALRGGHDATLLRKGADKGEVVLVLDDGTEIIKRITSAGSDTKVKQDGKAIGRPADTIKALTDLLSVNPVEFLTAAKKDRVQILLEAMPVAIDTSRLSEMAGVNVEPSLADAGLAAVDAVRRIVYDERTGTNRAVKEKQATISQLRATLPDHEAGARHEDSDDLMAQLNAMDAAKDAELERIRTKLEGLREESNQRVSALQAQIDQERAAFAEQERKAGAKREKTISEHATNRQGLADRLAGIQESQKAAARYDQTRDTISTMAEELDDLEKQAEAQTQALADLDDYKVELLASLPIPGLEVRDGEIYRDGVHFDRLNTGQRVAIAVEVAKLRAGELGVICVDGLELLDDEHYQAFREAALASGLQLFVTRVGDGEFSIQRD